MAGVSVESLGARRGSLSGCRLPCKARMVKRRPKRNATVAVRAEEGGLLSGFRAPGTIQVKRQRPVPSPSEGASGTQILGTQLRFGPRRDAGPSDAKTVFVAGATGKLGARCVRELLKLGFSVRAGVRNVEKAQEQAEFAAALGLVAADQTRRLKIVECDLERPETLRDALGNAAKVVCAAGAPEDQLLEITAPKRIDGQGTSNLVEAAAAAGVKQFVLVTSIGTGKFGWPAAILNLFWGVLIWKRKAEEALERSGMAYTIVRPGGMERPTDYYKETHNLTLNQRDTTFTGQVSRLQVAELVAGCCLNSDLAANKTLEVTASTEAPLVAIDDLLEMQPQEVSMEELAQRKEAIIAAENRLIDTAEQLDEAEASVMEAKEKRILLEQQVGELGGKLQQDATEAQIVLSQAEAAKRELESLAEQAEAKALEVEVAKALVDAGRQAAAEGRILTRKELRQVEKLVRSPPPPPPPPPPEEAAPAARLQEAKEEEAQAAAPVQTRAGLFGRRPDRPQPAAAVEEEEEEEEEPAPAVAKKPERKVAVAAKKPEPKVPVAAKEEPAKLVRGKAKPTPKADAKKAVIAKPETAAEPQVSAAEAVDSKGLAAERRMVAEQARKEAEEKRRAELAAVEEARQAAAAEEKARQDAIAKQEADRKMKVLAEQAAKAKATYEAQAEKQAERRAKEAAEAKRLEEARAAAAARAAAVREEAAARARELRESQEKARKEAAAKAKAKAVAKEEPREGINSRRGSKASGKEAPGPSKLEAAQPSDEDERTGDDSGDASSSVSPEAAEARNWIEEWRGKEGRGHAKKGKAADKRMARSQLSKQ